MVIEVQIRPDGGSRVVGLVHSAGAADEPFSGWADLIATVMRRIDRGRLS